MVPRYCWWQRHDVNKCVLCCGGGREMRANARDPSVTGDARTTSPLRTSTFFDVLRDMITACRTSRMSAWALTRHFRSRALLLYDYVLAFFVPIRLAIPQLLHCRSLSVRDQPSPSSAWPLVPYLHFPRLALFDVFQVQRSRQRPNTSFEGGRSKRSSIWSNWRHLA